MQDPTKKTVHDLDVPSDAEAHSFGEMKITDLPHLILAALLGYAVLQFVIWGLWLLLGVAAVVTLDGIFLAAGGQRRGRIALFWRRRNHEINAGDPAYGGIRPETLTSMLLSPVGDTYSAYALLEFPPQQQIADSTVFGIHGAIGEMVATAAEGGLTCDLFFLHGINLKTFDTADRARVEFWLEKGRKGRDSMLLVRLSAGGDPDAIFRQCKTVEMSITASGAPIGWLWVSGPMAADLATKSLSPGDSWRVFVESELSRFSQGAAQGGLSQ